MARKLASMNTQEQPQTLRDLAHERGLRLLDLGPSASVSVYNQGKVLPSPLSLRRIAERLAMPPQDVMAVCRAAMERRQAQHAGASA